MNNTSLSRRRLLQAAGGITFLALSADGRIALAQSPEKPIDYDAPSPVFKAVLYLQPGSNGGAVRDGSESLVLAWKTDRRPADFAVAYGPKGRADAAGPVTPTRTERYNPGGEDGKGTYDYAATLTNLHAGTVYEYRLLWNGKTVIEGYFTTRAPRGKKVRFAAFGDNSFGDVSDRMIAYQAYRACPEFVLNTGDNVYENGLCNEYVRYFFPIFNADVAHPRIGAPLLRSVPFYTVLANHDINSRHPETKQPVIDFSADADALGYYTCMHLPLNGPEGIRTPTPIIGDEKRIAVFRDAAGARFPRMGNYSFDYGDGHFLCLDSNIYVDPTDPALQQWIEADLAGTDAPWKFVCYHHPAFNAGLKHYKEQHMRVLSPLFERAGVAVVLHGHEHTYQRTRPLRFTPRDISRASVVGTGDRLVPGDFQVDRAFDGAKNTKPEGVIYITTGAAGKYLYDPEMDQRQLGAPERWRHTEDAGADYVERFISDRYSLTLFEMDARSLTLKQIDQWGEEIDRCRITRA